MLRTLLVSVGLLTGFARLSWSESLTLDLDLNAHRDRILIDPAATLSNQKVQFRCFELKHFPFFVGATRTFKILAPLSQVQNRLEDFENYQNYLPGLSKVKILQRNLDSWKTQWSERVPIPFVSDVVYTLQYHRVARNPTHLEYTYSFVPPGDIGFSKGLITLTVDSAKTTWYQEADFFSPTSAQAFWLSHKNFQSVSHKDLIEGDFAFILRCENPAMSFAEIRKISQDLTKNFTMNPCESINSLEFD